MIEQLLASKAGMGIGMFLLGASLAAIYMNSTEPAPGMREEPSRLADGDSGIDSRWQDFEDLPEINRSGNASTDLTLGW